MELPFRVAPRGWVHPWVVKSCSRLRVHPSVEETPQAFLILLKYSPKMHAFSKAHLLAFSWPTSQLQFEDKIRDPASCLRQLLSGCVQSREGSIPWPRPQGS